MDIFNDQLRQKARALENNVAASREYDPAAWQELIREFESAGRIAGADDIRRRAEQFAALAGRVVA